ATASSAPSSCGLHGPKAGRQASRRSPPRRRREPRSSRPGRRPPPVFPTTSSRSSRLFLLQGHGLVPWNIYGARALQSNALSTCRKHTIVLVMRQASRPVRSFPRGGGRWIGENGAGARNAEVPRRTASREPPHRGQLTRFAA